jgi:uncharacterized protein DUF4391
MSSEARKSSTFSVEDFYAQLGFPDASLLDRRIFKRMILAHGELTASDKRTLSDDVEKLTWKYALKASTVQVLPYEDAEREYLEIAVVESVLSSRRRAPRIAEMIQRAIPYPVLLIMVEDGDLCVSVAHKRFSQAEKGRIVAEDFLTSPWIGRPHSDLDDAFREALSMAQLSQVDFLALYRDMTRAVLARKCADLTGKFALEFEQSGADRRQRLEQYNQIEREISSCRAAILKEEKFAERVELNTRIKKLEAQLAIIKSEL